MLKKTYYPILLFLILIVSATVLGSTYEYTISNEKIEVGLNLQGYVKFSDNDSVNIDYLKRLDFFVNNFDVTSKKINILENEDLSKEIRITKNCFREKEHIIITDRYILKPDADYITQICELENKSDEGIKDTIRLFTDYSSVIPDLLQSRMERNFFTLVQYNDSSLLIIPESKVKKAIAKSGYSIIYYDTPEFLPGEKISFRNKIYIDKNSSSLQKNLYEKYNINYEKISGQVLNENDNKPMADIPVMAYEENGIQLNAICYTDINGDYDFYLPDDSYVISVDKSPYELISQNGNDLIISSPDENAFLWYPYITDLTENTVIVNFKLLIPSDSEVIIYDSDLKYINSFSSGKIRNLHHVELNGLDAGKEYFYIVKTLDEHSVPIRTENLWLRTLPEELTEFTFVNHSDTQLFYNRQRDKSELIYMENPLIITHSGDLTEDGPNVDMWNQFFDSHKKFQSHIPTYPTLGNHERNASNYYEAFDLPDDGGGDFGERWYAYEIGDVGFISLDSNILTIKSLNDQQTQWLIEKLQEFEDNAFTIVYYHHPFWTNNNNVPRSLTENEKAWRGLFEKYGVDLVMNGHIHAYEHFSRNGIEYITTGGGGAKLDNETGPDFYPWTVKTILGYYHYAVINVNTVTREMKITIKAFEKMTEPLCEECYVEEFKILDEFKISR